MKYRILALFLSLIILAASPATAIEFEFLTGPIDTASNFSLSHDGSRAAVSVLGQLYLMEDDVFTYLGQASSNSMSLGISADGSTIIGSTVDAFSINHATIWSEATGWQPEVLEAPAGYEGCDYSVHSGYALNGDGTKATGLLWDGCAGKAFLWTPETGMLDIGPIRGSTISADGTIIAGFDHALGRRPVYWTIDGTTATGPLLLHHEEDQGEVNDVTSDGSIFVGTAYPYGTPPEILGYQAFRWEPGDPEISLLGTLSGSNYDISNAYRIADNGVIVGTSGPSTMNVTAWIWTPVLGMVSLEQYLIDQGVTEITSSMNLTRVKAFSNDGSTLIGDWVDLYGGWGYFKVTFDGFTPVQDVPAAGSRLTGVHPNPFNPMTTVSFNLAQRQRAVIEVYNVAGRRVAMLADGVLAAGDHRLDWQGQDYAGREVASGSYVVRLVTEDGKDYRTITLVR